MESGLEGRNNHYATPEAVWDIWVSMESGLEGRNNVPRKPGKPGSNATCLNGVRPRRPEQLGVLDVWRDRYRLVSMESGLEGRNN